MLLYKSFDLLDESLWTFPSFYRLFNKNRSSEQLEKIQHTESVQSEGLKLKQQTGFVKPTSKSLNSRTVNKILLTPKL